ncbi:hypothetical protein IAT38_001079 [Cryptococcus sp. DSM 104549]
MSALHSLLSSLRAPIFQTLHNPTNARMGTKYLRRRLIGPAVASYYPQMVTRNPPNRVLNRASPSNPFHRTEEIKAFERQFEPVGWKEARRSAPTGFLKDPVEEKRVRKVEARRRLGKGPPKKGQGKRSQMKR